MTCNGSEPPQPSGDRPAQAAPTPQVAAVATPLTVNVPLPPVTPVPPAPVIPAVDPQPEPAPLKPTGIERVFRNLSYDRMVDVAFADDGTNRAFLALQPGQIILFDSSAEGARPQEFLDIRQKVNDRGNEEGLLGLDLDPEFSANGYFYVYYSASDPSVPTI